MTSLGSLTTLILNRYALTRELGHGGMATVYLANDLRHGRQVAVKILRPEVAAGLGVERFLREIRIVARLQHPHILGLIDSGEETDRLFFVMPYIEGESLRDRLARDGELAILDAVRLLSEIADALDYAHARGVVHRDIKPGNVLVADGHAYLADFGIAKAIREATDSTAGTAVGLAVGPPAYMAPEQGAADPSVDHRADLYALGVLAYEMLAGRPPFAGRTMLQVLAAHAVQTPEPLRPHRPEVPAELEQVVLRCLEKEPSDRWQSAAQVLDRLREISTGRGPRAIPPPPEPQTAEPEDKTFRLSEDVCRRLNRATLDGRMIGDEMHYLDNHAESDVLVCFVHPRSRSTTGSTSTTTSSAACGSSAPPSACCSASRATSRGRSWWMARTHSPAG